MASYGFHKGPSSLDCGAGFGCRVRGSKVSGTTIGALIVTSTILGAPDYIYSITGLYYVLRLRGSS